MTTMDDTDRAHWQQTGSRLEATLQTPSGDSVPFQRFRAAWSLLGQEGGFRLPLPPESGGRGALATVEAMEAMALGCRDLGFLFAASAHLWGGVLPLVSHGTPEQIETVLPGMLDGSTIVAHGVTEPETGSDVASLRTRIDEVDGRLRISGRKHLVTAAPVADLFVIYGQGAGGLRGALVPRGCPGLVVREQKKLGLLGAPMGEVDLDCELPASSALGPAGAGMALFQSALEWERIGIVAPLLGAMDRQLQRTVARARSRKQFGQPIGRFQAVAHRIVDMKLRLDIGRLLVARAAGLQEAGMRAPMEAAQAKLWVTEAFYASSGDAMRTWGGLGYLEDSEEARDLRDAAAGPFYSGTSDVQKNIIARLLGL